MRTDLPVLSVRALTKRFGDGCPACLTPSDPESPSLCRVCGTTTAFRSVDFDLYKGEVLGLVGESGSGKSSLVRCLYFDLDVDGGTIALPDLGIEDASRLPRARRRKLKDQYLAMVYQNVLMGLRLRVSAGGNVAEKLVAAEERRYETIRARSVELLERTEISRDYIDRLPRTFSGGMQQRVQIAKALANNPPIVFLDEVTTGLDVSVQARVLDLIRDLQREFGMSMIVVSHDLGVIRLLTDRTLVMRHGRVVERGLTDQILEDPLHPYTQLLVHSSL
jgi:putative phosphonate transport system ATP-binding protein